MEWAFPKYVYTMITPICMFYSTTLIVPARTDDEEVNLERHFSKVRMPVIWSFFIALLTQFADGPVLADEPLWFTGRLLQAVVLATVILGALARNKRLQALSPVGLLLFLGFVSITKLWTPGVIE